jgi:anti-sigma factor RsiW
MMKPPVQLSCQELVELVTDYFEGALSPDEARRFEEHVGKCAGCHVYVEQMRTTVALTGRVDGTGLAPEAEAALLRAFADWRSG